MTDTNLPADPKPADPTIVDPKPADQTSDDLKPLTDAEMESMTTEEITAHAEKLEAQVKAVKKQTPDEIRANQIKRAKNAQEKVFNPNTAPSEVTKSGEIAQADILTLAKSDFELGSPEQILLQQRIDQGVIKTYAEGLQHVGVKAEIDAIKAKTSAKTVIDENDDPETKLKTKKEAIAHARATGEVPEDPTLRQALVDDNIANMSSLK
jgi:hypothetical protein